MSVFFVVLVPSGESYEIVNIGLYNSLYAAGLFRHPIQALSELPSARKYWNLRFQKRFPHDSHEAYIARAYRGENIWLPEGPRLPCKDFIVFLESFYIYRVAQVIEQELELGWRPGDDSKQ